MARVDFVVGRIPSEPILFSRHRRQQKSDNCALRSSSKEPAIYTRGRFGKQKKFQICSLYAVWVILMTIEVDIIGYKVMA